MPLPSSGAISLSQVNTELALSSTATITMNAALIAAVKLAERVVALEARLAALEAKG